MKMKTMAAMFLLAAAVCAGLLIPAFVLRAMDAQLEKGEILVDAEMTELTKDRSSYYEALATTSVVDLSVLQDGAAEGCFLNEESARQRAAEILMEYAGRCPENYCPEGIPESILNGGAVSTCLQCILVPNQGGIVWHCEWDYEKDGDSGGAAVLIDDETGLLLGMAVYGQMGPETEEEVLGGFFASCCRISFGGAGENAVSGSVSGSLLHFHTGDGQELELPLIRYATDKPGEMLLAFNMPGTNSALFDEPYNTDAFLTGNR